MRSVYEDHEMAEVGFDFFVCEYRYGKESSMKVPHFHNYIEVTYVRSGTLIYQLGEREIAATAGETVVVHYVEPHAAIGTADPADIVVVGFRPELIWRGANDVDYRYIENLLSGEEVFENLIPASAPYSKTVGMLIEDMTREIHRREDGYKLMIKAKLLQMLTILYRSHPRVRSDQRWVADIEKFKEIVDYMQENAARPLTLAEVAQKAGYSPSYFSLMFHRVSGKRFSDILSEIRVEQCCRLLTATALPVGEIGRQCGLPNVANYTNLFRRFTGMTPSQYRKKYKQ